MKDIIYAGFAQLSYLNWQDLNNNNLFLKDILEEPHSFEQIKTPIYDKWAHGETGNREYYLREEKGKKIYDAADARIFYLYSEHYEEPHKNPKFPEFSEWEFLCAYDHHKIREEAGCIISTINSGFQASAFRKGNQIIIAYRGSDDISKLEHFTSDWAKTNLPIGTNDYVDQLTCTAWFYDKVVELASEKADIHITGHSLGGCLAQFAFIYSGCKHITKTWNGLGIGEINKEPSTGYSKVMSHPDFWEIVEQISYLNKNEWGKILKNQNYNRIKDKSVIAYNQTSYGDLLPKELSSNEKELLVKLRILYKYEKNYNNSYNNSKLENLYFTSDLTPNLQKRMGIITKTDKDFEKIEIDKGSSAALRKIVMFSIKNTLAYHAVTNFMVFMNDSGNIESGKITKIHMLNVFKTLLTTKEMPKLEISKNLRTGNLNAKYPNVLDKVIEGVENINSPNFINSYRNYHKTIETLSRMLFDIKTELKKYKNERIHWFTKDEEYTYLGKFSNFAELGGVTYGNPFETKLGSNPTNYKIPGSYKNSNKDFLKEDADSDNTYEIISGIGLENGVCESLNTDPLKQLSLDGIDISGIYDQVENDECSIREKHFGEDIILRDNRELTFYYGSNKEDKLVIDGFKNGDYGITLNLLEKDSKTIAEPKTYTPHKIKFDVFEFTTLLEFEINKEINNHTYIKVKGVIREEDADKYSDYLSDEKDPKIMITLYNNDTKILFKGFIADYNLKSDVSRSNILEFEAFSHSKKLERVKTNRVFQNKGTTYDDVLEIMMKSVNNGNDENAGYFINFSDSESGSTPLVTADYPVILQYKESEWDFLKRISTYLNKPIVIDDTKDDSESMNIQIGYFDTNPKALNNKYGSKRRKIENWKVYNYYKIDDYMQMEDNSNFDIGRIIKHNSIENQNVTQNLLIIKNKTKIMKGMLYSDIVMVEAEEININKEKRKGKIEGLTFRAEVKSVNTEYRAEVKFLDIEDNMKLGSAHLFPIDRPYGGTYFAPEIGDIVDIYFKSKNERHATLKSTTSDNGKDVNQNPDIKVMRTAFNKEMKFDQEAVTLTGLDKEHFAQIKENQIELISGNKSVRMLEEVLSIKTNERRLELSEKNINLVSGESIFDMLDDKLTMKNGSSQMNLASDKLAIQSDSSNILLNGSGIQIVGKKGSLASDSSKTELTNGSCKVKLTSSEIILG